MDGGQWFCLEFSPVLRSENATASVIFVNPYTVSKAVYLPNINLVIIVIAFDTQIKMI
jgi:hypothetical protein